MKRFTKFLGLWTLLAVWMAWMLVPNVAEGLIPERINLQGILRDAGGNPVADGSFSVIFTIYNADIGGTVFWAETTSVSTTAGLFNYRMGAANPIPDTAIRLNTWLGIKVGADPEMTPRPRLTSVSHAYKVSTVTGASGGVVTGDVYLQGSGADDVLALTSTADPNIALELRSGTSGGDPYIDFANDAASDFDARIQLLGDAGLKIEVPSTLAIPTGNVGIGTTSPSDNLDVRGNIKLGSSGELFATSGDENLRIIRGTVLSAGGIVAGSGFSVSKTGTGTYTITFTTAFSGTPTPLVSRASSGAGFTTVSGAVLSTDFGVATFNSGGAAADAAFTFVVIGPR